MVYRVKTYTLREETAENGTRYFISFKDGQGGYHELEASEQFFIEFRHMERRNRNLLQWSIVLLLQWVNPFLSQRKR